MILYRERMWPAPWLFASTALVIPASLLVFLPINLVVGIAAAAVLYSGSIALLLLSSPLLLLTEQDLRAGRARIPVGLIGTVHGFHGAEATLERGRMLDARAYLVIRGWIDPVLRINILDPEDPTPYWLLSTRKPAALAAAITAATAQ